MKERKWSPRRLEQVKMVTCTFTCGYRQWGRMSKWLSSQARVAKAIQSLLLVPRAKAHKSIRREFKVMEKKKLAIDNKVDTMVRHELWGGLGFMMELSWIVMKPICFYLTSMYCMESYTFFLRTSKEPSFEGFYQVRFSSEQKHLMKLHNFDIEKYNHLRAACSSSTMPPKFDPSIALPFENSSIHQ
ncbi:hypothetical protein JHK82_022305 [Glycine max]|nr:hypothetical protein JHK85_022792 [Glycine max]KAG5026414.1 hypothetical protein JHK86_022328 [Glycine max]KAG5137574.1 hypothetical protein JHK82_022305 [Glycine max]